MIQRISKLPGRPHDVFSYSVALTVFLVAALFGAKVLSLPPDWATIGTVAALLWCEHFLRRIIECLWVHRYANRVVPIGDALGEYVYYWGFGIWNAYALRSKGTAHLDGIAWLGLAIFIAGEIGNTWAHLKLRSLRRPNTVDRGIPVGGLFNWVSCANYTYEFVAWSGFCVLTRTWASLVYLVGIAVVLGSWAHKRQVRYRELFDGRDGRPMYPVSRRAFIPLVF